MQGETGENPVRARRREVHNVAHKAYQKSKNCLST